MLKEKIHKSLSHELSNQYIGLIFTAVCFENGSLMSKYLLIELC